MKNSNMSFHGVSNASWTTFFLCFSLLHLVHPYTPVDLFTVNCGSSGNSSDNDRSWIGDIDSKLLSLTDSPNNSVTLEALTQSPSVQQVPYSTARLSRSQFSYSFPLTQGPKFLRLFFYPASYPGFDRFNAFFTVKSGNITFLKDFNASLNADFEKSDTIFLEYCIYVDDGERLNLTFTTNKTTTTNPDLYAFVNGIEIVSMPDYLYYSEPDGFGFKLVGSTTQFTLDNNIALQTYFRLAVGESALSPREDTGMLRSWEYDGEYVYSNSALSSDIYNNVSLSFSQIPNYTAPEQIYRAEREMGPNKNANQKSNLTWVFPVDSGFTYMLRLHFCELDPNIDEHSNRLFDIYIADQLAEESANVLNWGKGRGVPVYRDYAILVSGDQKTESLSLKLHPSPNSEYSDAFLNALEIFKISDLQRNNLAGPNPDPLPPTPPKSNQKPAKKSEKSRSAIIIGIVVAVAVVLLIVVLAFGVVFFLINRRKKTKDFKSSDGTCKWFPFYFATTKSATNSQDSSLPLDLCNYFSITDIRAATNNFDELLIIGVGGFGHVYKGYINNGQTPVAIKRLKPGSQQGVHEFRTEIQMLSQLRHRHLVSLIGYSIAINEMILVYEYMARGTLSEYLYNNKTQNPCLPWKQRLRICIDAAWGLHYLHAGATHPIIHRDVKSANILLDEKWVAKVSDFGLSKFGPTGMSKSYVSTVVKGSVGYLDPEYYKRQHLTVKSDVYSFGVVLFEVLGGRPPFFRTRSNRQVLLADWAKHCCSDMGTVGEIVDPVLKLKGNKVIAPLCLNKFVEVGLSCLRDNAAERPSMNDVVGGLELALQLQEEAEQHKSGSEDDDVEGEIENEEYYEYECMTESMRCYDSTEERFTSRRKSGDTKTIQVLLK